MESTVAPHWHIDYLLKVAKPVEVWYTMSNQKLEHHWAELLEKMPRFRVPIRRLGSSDYHRSRSSHLFVLKATPSFQWFRQKVAEHFERFEVKMHSFALREIKDDGPEP